LDAAPVRFGFTGLPTVRQLPRPLLERILGRRAARLKAQATKQGMAATKTAGGGQS
jgi:hypothetical protein